VKKWSCVIVTRFAQRYGQPRYATDQTRAFAKLFYHKVTKPKPTKKERSYISSRRKAAGPLPVEPFRASLTCLLVCLMWCGEQMAVQLLEPMVELMCLRAKGQFCTDRVRQPPSFYRYDE
jgi:hypothetical protein